MKRIVVIASVVLAAAFASCKPEYTTYSGGSWVMFADTLTVCPVPQPVSGNYSEPFAIPIVATQTADHDRNFAVEIAMEDLTREGAQENAIFGKHYRLVSNTVTIPAGKNTAEVKITGRYDNLEQDVEPVFKLRLLPEADVPEWVATGRETKVRLKKSCPFDINDFTGYCLVFSQYLTNHPYIRQSPRLIETEKVAGEDNALWLRGFFIDGYDIKVKIDPSDLLEPKISIAEGAKAQVIGDTRMMEIAVLGDGRVRVTDYPGMVSAFDACDKTAQMFLRMTVSNFLPGGQDALYATDVVLLEWISDVEAQDYL